MLIATVDASTTLYTDTEVKDGCWGKVYVYYVRSRVGSYLSPRGEGATLSRIAPMAFTYYKNDAAGAATLKWDVEEGTNQAKGYELQYAESREDLYAQSGTFKKVGGMDTRKSREKTVTGLTKGKTYYFRVRAYTYYTHSGTGVTTQTWSQQSKVAAVTITK